MSRALSGDDRPGEGQHADPLLTDSERLAELLTRACVQDDAAFSEVYIATWPAVFDRARRIIWDRAQAAEIAQEVFLDLWRQRAVFDPDLGNPLNWLLLLAHRRAVDRVRSVHASAARDGRHAFMSTTHAVDFTSDQAHARVTASELDKLLLEHVSPSQRQAISLAFIHGFTHTEIALLLGIPLGTAKTRIRDGLQRLRPHLDP